jgi:hypothetical protein
MRTSGIGLVFLFATACTGDVDSDDTDVPVEPVDLRVMQYNVSLFGDNVNDIPTRLEGDDEQARRVAEVLQILRPDVVLINELDTAQGRNGASPAELLNTGYFAVGQNGLEPLDYPFVYVAESNTGVSSGEDLDGDGSVTTTPGSQDYGNDSFGFGEYPGQYGFAVFSRFPLGTPRTFRETRWVDVPDNSIPPDFYSPEALDVFRISSKNHVDVPIELDNGEVLHLLASHPTPPSFDGPEDRNGRRNFDEIKVWADYLDGGPDSWHVDDAGVQGALTDEHFVIVGDLNADPNDGGSRDGAIAQLLDHPRVQATPAPESLGGVEQSAAQGGINTSHTTPPAQDTADFEDQGVGNLRLDYALPSTSMTVNDAGVFWPEESDPDFALIGTFPFPISDHRPVWVDVSVP